MALDLIDELLGVVRCLGSAGVGYAVCGGLAVTIHGAVRTTRDIDVLVAPEDADRAVESLAQAGFVHAALPMVFGAGTPAEREIRRVSKIVEGQVRTVDLLLATGALRPMLDGRTAVSWADVALQVVSLEDLMAMKRLAGRHQDLADVERLEAVAHERR
ncbi:MAG: nucleotidyltransferase [Deltaproteobacteria bacterium]|nr:nucleotidyltransferase [Deltaproteobacteria bacterium]